jgi:hypothetical protein
MIVGVTVQKPGTLSWVRLIVGIFSGVNHVFMFGLGPSGPAFETLFVVLQPAKHKKLKKIIINNVFMPTIVHDFR